MCIGIIVGRVLLNPYVFFLISTLEFPKVYFRSTSVTCFLVFPSKTNNFGAIEYPLPTEDTPIDPKVAKDSICIIWGNPTLGLKVGSDGKLYPILLN